jgi:hypothetical protein
MKRLLFALLLVLVALSVLLWRLPANLALAALPANALKILSPHASIHELNGTMWQGDAQLTITAIPSTQRIAWRCTPKLFSAMIDCTLSDAVSGKITLHPLSQSLNVNDVKSAMPLRFIAPGATIVTSDKVSVNINRGEFSAKNSKLTATMTAVNAATRIGDTATALGEISLDCTPLEGTAGSRCTLRNRASENRLDGQMDLNPNRASGNISFAPVGGVRQSFSF